MSQIFVITGPSGVGKDTLANRLLQDHPNFIIPSSYTTRPPRPVESNKKIYHFVTQDEFMQAVESDMILEYENEHGYLYGTDKKSLMEALDNNQTVVAVIEPRGAATYKKIFNNRATVIFITPPSIDSLKERITSDPKRGGVSQEEIDKRLEAAKDELKYQNQADFVLVNHDDQVAQTYQGLLEIIQQKNTHP